MVCEFPDDEHRPKTQTEFMSSGSGIPPRPTATGLSDSDPDPPPAQGSWWQRLLGRVLMLFIGEHFAHLESDAAVEEQ
jgi:hypothetical protein